MDESVRRAYRVTSAAVLGGLHRAEVVAVRGSGLAGQTAARLAAESGDLCDAELRSAASTSRLLANAILAQKRRRPGRKEAGQ
jgi:hypothetical protein